ncbi:CotY/CotZ family spore coat protein [Gracilibacillus sp. S3-1-1]|uniref:CotY/CotZ family spore coat protein n=1 Tax=Gracilibacillus pellucidus TaxID=3095368 RepID=A0ACC6M4B1_9BACI|nr:CotY/CotZ family spore coat protein [Gracilibacillus sp. S3-1-1]MDX8045816.1 CotY/CotZ family spore coat protein [Gracilibacillus sp. S3-1-1]
MCSKHSCVEEVVKSILDAQDDALDNQCDISCHRSIQDLVSPTTGNGYDTVPFILFDKKGNPFKGVGVQGTTQLNCVESFIFRVTSVKDSCVTLELLTTESDSVCKSPCEQLDGENVQNIERTGICITVDLSCFCAISCLPAISLF